MLSLVRCAKALAFAVGFRQSFDDRNGIDIVKIDESFNANNCDWSTANGVSNMKTLGLAEFQASVANAGDYFWAMVAGRGGALVNVLSTAARRRRCIFRPQLRAL